jgi:energy-coupling factor transporter transmembrane protein EcfT
MRFGNTLTSIRPGIAMMALLGIVVGIIGLVAGIMHHTLGRTWPFGVLLVIALPAVFFLGCLPTLAFSIRIEKGRVQDLLLNYYVLSDFPVEDFKSMKIQRGPWAAQIFFTHNRSIRFIGAHLGELAMLNTALKDAKRKAGQPSESSPPSLA